MATGLSALVIGLVVSHLAAYDVGHEHGKVETRQETFFLVTNTMYAAESVGDLGILVRALRAAVKDRNAYRPQDLEYLRTQAKSIANDMETRIIPAIRADEAQERQRESARTEEGEKQRIEVARKLASEALELDRLLEKN
ncbi:hypothetical protein FRUB_00957 [Fimbriiglobus ruber]|uniref:Uncharacterized protein n=1 Tax=Fimbriiglobus ruber TaxID=1908690 RepID=A0A225E929_9BACT|nr:hypothetical protein FRUB_00957 [Fimbriiglobus ruber]